MIPKENTNPYILCLWFGIGVWVLTFLSSGIFPGLVLLPASMWLLKGIKLIPAFQACGERWWGAMFFLSMIWPFCLFLSVALVFWIGKNFNDGAKVLLWLLLSVVLTLVAAYPIITWTMNDQLKEDTGSSSLEIPKTSPGMG